MGVILIIIGIAIALFWANDYNKGQENPMFARRVHDAPVGCVPWIIAVILIGIGIYLLFD